ncbi:MAG TPA: uroporphyrinogen-III synthase [Steroidobacteraceae bacterium]|nr:uroporphyrinogen-III synthase [Steroidobacteraceae bacterium]
MIPFPIASLTGITVLVTRPQPQAQVLCERIVAQGGAAIALSAIAIEPVHGDAPSQEFDWWIFISANAVQHGWSRLPLNSQTRVAAIGKATASALARRDVSPDAVPESGSTSEALLAHPAFSDVAGKRVLIVKGEGGREQLLETLTARGAQVSTFDVYRRCRPIVDAASLDEVQRRWMDEGVDIVTLTSVETLRNLQALLPAACQDLLATAAFVAPSQRIIDAARAVGLRGDGCLAKDADDDAVVGAIAAWHARAR